MKQRNGHYYIIVIKGRESLPRVDTGPPLTTDSVGTNGRKRRELRRCRKQAGDYWLIV